MILSSVSLRETKQDGDTYASFSYDGVQKVYATERACDERVDGLAEALNANLSATANVGEHVALPQFNKSKLGIV